MPALWRVLFLENRRKPDCYRIYPSYNYESLVLIFLLDGGRSEILGGLGIIKGWVKCRKIGSLYETKTNLIVGIEPSELEEYLEMP